MPPTSRAVASPRSLRHAAQRRPGRATALLSALGLVAVLVVAPPDAGAQTLDDLDEAEDRVEDIEDDLGAATAAYEETWARIETAEVELAALRREVDQLAAEAALAAEMVNTRARGAFMRGTTDVFEVLLGAESPSAAVERAGLIELLHRREQVRVEDAIALQVALDQAEELIEQRQAELDAERDQLRAHAEELQDQLALAQSEAEQIRSLVSRQRRIDRGPQQGIYACIFDPGTFQFRDTWGAPRSGGRRHKGTDVFAPMNQPTFAFTSGVIERHSSGGLGGIGLYLRGDDNNLYYYAHLASIEPSAYVGARVVAGELVARNGYSGNADPWAPHVHFELHPGGGAPINPYPWLAAACF